MVVDIYGSSHIRSVTRSFLSQQIREVNMGINHPMLAAKVEDLQKLRFPIIASPKLDGVRALKIGRELVSRNWKPIPNIHVRNVFAILPDNVDGELIGDDGTPAGIGFNATQSLVMSEDGTPDVLYHVFDYVENGKDMNRPFILRRNDLARMVSYLPKERQKYIRVVEQVNLLNIAELLAYERTCLALGYEGVMIRGPNSPYKEGRSTVKEGYLLKLKRFEDS